MTSCSECWYKWRIGIPRDGAFTNYCHSRKQTQKGTELQTFLFSVWRYQVQMSTGVFTVLISFSWFFRDKFRI